MLSQREEYLKMAEAERTLWWYCVLHRMVLEAIQRQGIGREAAIIDAGCGTGGLMLALKEQGYTNVRGFDLSEHAVEICRRRQLDVGLADLTRISSLYPHGSADVLISNDTLYLFDARTQADITRRCADILRPGGLLILNVPALRAFGGIHDIIVGIRYRFSRADTGRLLDPSRFDVLAERFWPFLLSPIIYMVRLSQRRRIRKRENFRIKSDLDITPRWLNGFLLQVTLFENRTFGRKPFGSSLFLVGRKKGP
jgi:SAM-dependent methyltransferase